MPSRIQWTVAAAMACVVFLSAAECDDPDADSGSGDHQGVQDGGGGGGENDGGAQEPGDGSVVLSPTTIGFWTTYKVEHPDQQADFCEAYENFDNAQTIVDWVNTVADDVNGISQDFSARGDSSAAADESAMNAQALAQEIQEQQAAQKEQNQEVVTSIVKILCSVSAQ